MRSFTILIASALAAFAGAQTVTSTSSSAAATSVSVTTTSGSATSVVAASTQSQSMPAIATAGFNPNNVSSTDKANWCRAQRNSCPAVCGGGPIVNQCDDVLLTYSCTCYNGTVPDLTRYQQTLPFFICKETFRQCINAHPDDQAGQSTCTDNAQCGTIVPPGITTTVVASSTTSGSGSGGSTTRASSGSATSSSPTGAAVTYGTELTTGAFAALLMAAFRLFL